MVSSEGCLSMVLALRIILALSTRTPGWSSCVLGTHHAPGFLMKARLNIRMMKDNE